MKRIALSVLILFVVGFTIQAIPVITQQAAPFKGIRLPAQGNQTHTPRPTPIPTRWQDDDDSIMASVQMEQFILKKLKTPSTAEFPEYSAYNTGINSIRRYEQTYTFWSWVDSQNLFGAMVRTRYNAQIEQTAPGEWRLISFKVID